MAVSDVPGGFLASPPRSWLDMKCAGQAGGVCGAGAGSVISALVTKTMDSVLVAVSNFRMIFVFS